MYSFSRIVHHKQTPPEQYSETPYLLLGSEPQETGAATARRLVRYRSRHLGRRHITRTVRRLRQG
jgi:hypothetical protein